MHTLPRVPVYQTSVASMISKEDEEEEGDTHFSLMKGIKFGVTEVFATALLLMLGCLGGTPVHFGFAIMVTVQLFSHITGAHMNPAVTIAACIHGELRIQYVPFYIVAQFGGACAGYGFVYMINDSTASCETLVKPGLDDYKAVLLEFIFTMILIIILCSLWDAKNMYRDDTVAIKLGFMLMGVFLVGNNYTGASLNSARSFAPAAINNNWPSNHWVYWVGPNVAAVIGPLVYRFLMQKVAWRKS